MRAVIFDAGPIISLTTNNLLWLLEPLKKKFKGDFYLAESVRKELVDKPLNTKKFKFEALQVQKMIEKGVLKVVKSRKVQKKAEELLGIANNVFHAQNHPIYALQIGELESLAAAKVLGIPYVVVDERITRLLLENPGAMEQLLERRLHTDVHVRRENLLRLHKEVEGVKLVRSFELAAVAYELGLLDDYVAGIPEARKQLLQAVLWGIKLNGCSVGQDEIDDIVSFELKRK